MKKDKKITKKQFLSKLKTVFISFTAIQSGIIQVTAKALLSKILIRPPGALPENTFIQRCIRCGNCLKICPTNVLQPLSQNNSFTAMWTPHLKNTIGYCEYECNLCSKVCPTGAIKKITIKTKKKLKIGLAVINRNKCIPWSAKQNCIVCEEHCPISTKAIKIENVIRKDGTVLMLPHVDKNLCIGCGICENKCPTRPDRSIIVENI